MNRIMIVFSDSQSQITFSIISRIETYHAVIVSVPPVEHLTILCQTNVGFFNRQSVFVIGERDGNNAGTIGNQSIKICRHENRSKCPKFGSRITQGIIFMRVAFNGIGSSAGTSVQGIIKPQFHFSGIQCGGSCVSAVIEDTCIKSHIDTVVPLSMSVERRGTVGGNGAAWIVRAPSGS